MPVKLGGAGGGAGDTYTASTATAGIAVQNGKLYALSSTGALAPSIMKIEEENSFPIPNSVSGGSAYDHANRIYGDMVTPDGKATFHLISDAASNAFYGIFYLSLDGGTTNNGLVFNVSSGTPFDEGVGYNGSASGIYLKMIGEETDYWFYTMWFHGLTSSGGATSWRSIGRGFMVRKDNHQFHNSGGSQHDGNQAPIFSAFSNTAEQRITNEFDYSRQSKHFFYTCRSGDIFVWTTGEYQMPTYGFRLFAVDTYRSSDSSYWGGTNIGLPKSSGSNEATQTHRDNVTAETHLPLFKVDDANGIFVAPYWCASGTNNGEAVFLKYTIAADHTITTSSEILITGTDPTNAFLAQGGHWIATTDPLIYWYTYGDYSNLYYIKVTFNADWTAAAWSGQSSIAFAQTPAVLPWQKDQDAPALSCLHSFPEKELFFVTSKNAAAKNAMVFSFPSSGSPSYLGLTTLNNTLSNIYGQKMIMQSMNNGSMISITHPWVSGESNGKEQDGYACYYTDHFNPNFKKTADVVAIARADGAAGTTVNIDLKSGDTASATLSSDYYATKEGMSYPLDVEGGASAAFTTAIKSIQRGLYNLSATSATTSITAVDTTKSFVSSSSSSSSGADEDAYVQLTDSTTLTFVRNSNSGTTDISWEVIEFV